MSYPKVSVVTITYGHEKYIIETLQGVLMQQYNGPIEFIIANDNSPDRTDEVVQKYFKKNPAPANFEVKYTKHATNKGMMPNFVWALEQASGKYIALCEGDDYWNDPLKLQKQVRFLERNVGYVAITQNGIIKDSIRNLEKPFSSRKNGIIDIQDMLVERQFPTASILYRNIPLKYYYGGDTVLWINLATQGKIYYQNIITSVYRRGLQGVTENTAKKKWAYEMRRWNKSLHQIISHNKIAIPRKIFKHRNQKEFFAAFVEDFLNKNYLSAIKLLIISSRFGFMQTFKDLSNIIRK